MIQTTEYDRVVGLKWFHSGQPRPYADSIYEAELLFTGKNIAVDPKRGTLVVGCHPEESFVRKVARLLVHEWVDEPLMLEPHLAFLRCEEKGEGFSRWRVRVVVPFCD